MKLVVTGGRDYEDYERVREVLSIFKEHGYTELAHGGARGLDSLAGKAARDLGYVVRVYPADWATYGRTAGPIRNREMLATEKPDHVLAFPGGRGTADCVKRAKALGLSVEVVK